MDKYFCSDCDRDFATELSLATHNRNIHDITRYLEVFENILIDYEQRQATQEAKNSVAKIKLEMLTPMKVRFKKLDVMKRIKKKIKDDVNTQSEQNRNGKGRINGRR